MSPPDRLVAAFNDQIGREFAAAHQYVAVGAYYDGQTFPQLAKFFYEQADEERMHAMKMLHYLLETGAQPQLAEVPAPQGGFGDHVEPIALALEQERRNTEAIGKLFEIARETGEHATEVFLHWFVEEQVEEESLMGALLQVAERVRDSPMMLEEFVARDARNADAARGSST